ncbi:MAG TPA: hemolysin family protein [Chitinophagales bacterium]|jgi:putative hemolysin|nr:hemolysin family protein [Chitinophagales bacterium]HQO32319.1 hemolysin family protein [Chitinophagales bacterium]HQO88552.1 hemolysin family protein [Chitinophagales bacterium]
MEILIILVLTLVNGFFALSEIALVSVKKSSMEHLAAQGNSRAKMVLQLLENPENFLSSVQVGITLIGIVSGAYGGAALTDDLDQLLSAYSLNPEYVHVFSLITVIGGITYFSIVIGELVPKSIAMNNAERIALIAVPIMKYFTLVTYPFVRILSGSTQLILRLMGIKQNDADHVSEEELRFMLKNAGKQGVLETEESQVHQNLFYFTDQTAKSLLTHRSEMEWINSEDSLDEIFDLLKESVHSKFVVGEGSLDKVLGVITIKDFLSHYKRPDFRLADIISAPIFIIQNTPAFKILNLFKTKKQYIAIVVDEFGMTKGIITLHDLMEAIVGELPDEDEVEETYIIQRSENSYLIDGKTLIYELNQYFQREIIQDNIALYTTISGFILAQLKDLPKPGDQLTHDNYLFEIMDMDGVRIDKILMTRQEDGAL